MKMNKRQQQGGIFLAVAAILFLIWFIMLIPGCSGAGYASYYRPASWWYWGGPSIYHDRSVRSGSAWGNAQRGGGISAGK